MIRLPTLKWAGDRLELIDQTLLPAELVIVSCHTVDEVVDAIKRLAVRGAPAIGVAAAYGVVLGARESITATVEEMKRQVKDAAAKLTAARPTAVNLGWAVARMVNVTANSHAQSPAALYDKLLKEAQLIEEEDRRSCRRLGEFGAALLRDGDTVLTHCNAGALATVDYGTALGVIYAAVEQGKRISVIVDETRPLLQGARLTTWELMQAGIPTTLICDNMAASVMAAGKVDAVIVGADRIAANGDVANKIGTAGLAALARRFLIPFYVAAPLSSIDFGIKSGTAIPIEQRSRGEVTTFGGKTVAPVGVDVLNPAFDVTPALFVDAIITEKGIARPPYETTLAKLADVPS